MDDSEFEGAVVVGKPSAKGFTRKVDLGAKFGGQGTLRGADEFLSSVVVILKASLIVAAAAGGSTGRGPRAASWVVSVVEKWGWVATQLGSRGGRLVSRGGAVILVRVGR